MKILHLSEDEATQIAKEWSRCLVEKKAHQEPILWDLIHQIEITFHLNWREDKKMFKRPV